MAKHKVTIIGAGNVGATTAQRIFDQGYADVVLIDILEGIPHLKAMDGKHYLQSDLLRILVLYKYGGVWVDMDIIFLRDFKPLFLTS